MAAQVPSFWLATVASLTILGPATSGTSRDATLRAYLQRVLGPVAETPNTATSTVWSDLNGDGHPEAIVYVFGPERCGSGGCDLLILEQTADGFRKRAELSDTRPPVGVLQTRTAGWRHIAVRVGGGGIINGYMAEVPFHAGRYASNPTVPPTRKLTGTAKPTIIMTGDEKGERLFDKANRSDRQN